MTTSLFSKDKPGQRNPQGARADAQTQAQPQGDGRIAVDGFEQVFEMLKIADPAFRESLLKRLAARDVDLARSLRARLAAL